MDRNKIIKACEESIQHWERMLEWVKKHKLVNIPQSMGIMERALKENWQGGYCPLCILYKQHKYQPYGVRYICPLFAIGSKCDYESCDDDSCVGNYHSPWWMVNTSLNWGEWEYNTEKYMLPALRKALEYAKGLDEPKIFSSYEDIKESKVFSLSEKII